jgi:predicted membrane protein
MEPEKLKRTFLHRLSLKESWVIFFILGLIMLNYPFLSIFNKPIILLGFPLSFIYIFGGWWVSILVIYLFTLSIKHENRSDNGPDN